MAHGTSQSPTFESSKDAKNSRKHVLLPVRRRVGGNESNFLDLKSHQFYIILIILQHLILEKVFVPIILKGD